MQYYFISDNLVYSMKRGYIPKNEIIPFVDTFFMSKYKIKKLKKTLEKILKVKLEVRQYYFIGEFDK